MHLTYYRKCPDPLIHSGQHFGWAVFSFCNVHTLIVNGLSQLADDLDPPLLTARYMSSLNFKDNLAHHTNALGSNRKPVSFMHYLNCAMASKTD